MKKTFLPSTAFALCATSSMGKVLDFTTNIFRPSNRQTSAAHTGQGNFSTGYGYDLNGNLTCLTRIGRLSGDTYGPTDSLTFIYSGNQVTRIDDSAGNATSTGRYDFRNGANQEGEYAYDANGNMTRDLNKKLSSIQYNSRNLPERINFTDGKYITYVYDATGQKLRVNYRPSQTATTGFQMDYCGNLQYENGLLKRILVDGGYVSFSGGTPYYHYYLTDHLGSNRVVMNKSTGATIQVNHYYPYGGLFATSTNVAGLYYKFNGKEIDHRYNLELTDYGARFYDALRASWLTMDPLCEKYYDLSPYAMCGDNPVNAVDKDGRDYNVYKNTKEKTYTIKADYHTTKYAAESANNAVGYWNNLSGKYKLDDYTIKIDLEVYVDGQDIGKTSSGSNQNSYAVIEKLNNNKTGTTVNGNKIRVREDKMLGTTGAHEVGHSLGLGHRETGIMTSELNDKERFNNDNQEADVLDIVKAAQGSPNKLDLDESEKDILGKGTLIIER